MNGLRRAIVWFAMLLPLVSAASAQEADRPVVGTIAELEKGVDEFLGTVRATDPDLGRPVRVGSDLRTDPSGRLFVNLQDRSAVQIAHDSRLLITEAGRTVTGLRFKQQLRQGKIRVLVSEGSEAQVAAPTGVALSRGTDFIVAYDPVMGRTDVLALSHHVEVRSAPRRRGGTVVLSRYQRTTVFRGKAPTPPVAVDDATVEGYLEEFEFIGRGKAESLMVGNLIFVTIEEPPGLYHPGLPFPRHLGPIPDPPVPPGPIADPPFVPVGGLVIRY